MGKIITVAIEKGGVGKTTTVLNLAAIASMNGKRVLVVDMDAQANCTKCLSGGKDKSEYNDKGVFNMLRCFGMIDTINFIVPTNIENVDMIPSNEYASQILNYLPIMKSQYGKPEYVYLAACLASIIDKYDVIYIDTPPSKDYLVSSALYCADEVIIPFYPDGYSADGMNSVYALIHKLCEDEGINIHIMGILFTKVEKTNSMEFMKESLRDSDFGQDLFDTEIRKSVACNDASIMSKPVVMSDRKSNPAKDYMALYEEIEKRMNKH